MSLFASLVFEQSYGGVEGDGASAAELLALLSAHSLVPLRRRRQLEYRYSCHRRREPENRGFFRHLQWTRPNGLAGRGLIYSKGNGFWS
jgi:hypothetical protein